MAIINDAALFDNSVEVLIEYGATREKAIRMAMEPGVMETVVTNMWQAQENTLRTIANERNIKDQ